MPFSLARGQINAGPFKVNLKDEYGVRIETGWDPYFDPNCASCNLPKAHRFLYKDGHLVARWIEYRAIHLSWGFNSEKGTYELDLEVLSDSGCLDPGYPRLLIYTSEADYDAYADPILWASGFGIALGASLIALGFIAFSEE